MKIEIGLNTKDIKKAIKELEYIKGIYPKMIDIFINKSLDWIVERANLYLDTRTHGFKTSDIRTSWRKDKIEEGYYRLVNTSKVAVYAEFGTGLVGKQSPHPNAKEDKYDYDVNNHGIKGWNFVNHELGFGLQGFCGYEGHAYLYDAYFDYFYVEKQYLTFWNSIKKEYIG